jgi:hypothetical protein
MLLQLAPLFYDWAKGIFECERGRERKADTLASRGCVKILPEQTGRYHKVIEYIHSRPTCTRTQSDPTPRIGDSDSDG